MTETSKTAFERHVLSLDFRDLRSEAGKFVNDELMRRIAVAETAAEVELMRAEERQLSLVTALKESIGVLEMMVEPDAIEKTSITSAYALCVQAASHARKVLSDMGAA
jgi:hypothetical protein